MDEAKTRTAATYNIAADFFDAPPLAFWDRIGRRTVAKMFLTRGSHVLDACCGSGASAIPAAEAVGPGGRVLGLDLAQHLLQLARAKAQRRGLSHVEFRVADFEALDPSAETFDAVICVFGIFFVTDMPKGVRHLWQLVRPGGQLAVTTWGPRVFEPGSSALWELVRQKRSDLYKGFHPWDRINDPNSLAAMLLEAGVQTANVVAEEGSQSLSSPEDFWTIAMGTGFRATIEQMDQGTRESVRTAILEHLSRTGVRHVETNALYALGRKA